MIALQKIIEWLRGSFDVSDKGASATKLTSFLMMMLFVWIHLRFCDTVNCIEFLITDGSLILALLGVATWDKLKTNKQNTDAEPQN